MKSGDNTHGQFRGFAAVTNFAIVDFQRQPDYVTILAMLLIGCWHPSFTQDHLFFQKCLASAFNGTAYVAGLALVYAVK